MGEKIMSALKLFRLLQDLVGKLNSIAVGLRDEKLTSVEAENMAKTLIKEFIKELT